MNDSTLVLTESKSARANKMASMTHDSAMNALCKAKALVMAMWQGTGVATTEQMADYYEVPVDTVKSVVKNNRDELTSDGLKVLRGKDLKDVRLVIDLTSEQNSNDRSSYGSSSYCHLKLSKLTSKPITMYVLSLCRT